MAVLHQEFYKNTGKGQGSIAVNRDIRNYIEGTPSGDFSCILEKDDRWQVFYHLSDMRVSILNWYEFKKDSRLLEIGGEFGALTGLFCDRCKQVVTTEYGLFKAQAITERWKNQVNLDVYAGDVRNMDFGELFDYIVIIGALERQCGGSKKLSDYVNYLKNIRRFLKIDGKMIIAVENRYGLRYFCGEREAYTRQPFGGLNQYCHPAKGYTFSRSELERVIQGAGLLQQRFYYPLPDYKLPQMIYSDEYLPKKDMGERLLFYHTDASTLLAPEQWIYADIIENRVFPFFANSFLVECGTQGDKGTAVFAAVTTDRGRIHGLATSVHQLMDKEKHKIVKKRALYKEGQERIHAVYKQMIELEAHGVPIVPHKIEDNEICMPFVPQITCSDYLRTLAARGDSAQFEHIFELIYENILKSSQRVSEKKNALPEAKKVPLNYGIILEKCYVDMVPFNCFFIDGKLFYFDQEFVKENYPAAYPMYRALMYTYAFIPEAEKMVPLERMKEKYGLMELWDIFRKEEDRFVADNRRYDIYKNFYKWTGIDHQEMLLNAENLGTVNDETISLSESGSEEALLEQIKAHEVISFSIEDTLLMYRTLLEEDAETIVQKRSRNKENIEAGTEEIRLSLLTPRRKMVNIFQQCIVLKKEVYLITDMKVSRNRLEPILNSWGISGYVELVIGKEKKLSKRDGLLGSLKVTAAGRSWLHVGTEISEVMSGADRFLIKSARDMLSASSYAGIRTKLHTINERSLAGMFIAEVFNDPFALDHTDGKPEVSDIYQIAYLFVAPMITAFVLWMAEQLEKGEYEDILFAARDGYLVQKLYDFYRIYANENLPEGQYFLTSRRAASGAGMMNEDDIRRIFSLPYEKKPQEVLRDKFNLEAEEIPEYEMRHGTLLDYALDNQKLIYEKSSKQRLGYLNYIKGLKLKPGKTYAFFDLATSGTTQYYLSRFTPFHLHGLGLLWYDVGDEGKRALSANALYQYGDGVISSEFENYFRWNYAFLEPMLTSPDTSVYYFTEDGKPQYGAESRTDKEVLVYREAQKAIKDFFEKYLTELYIPGEVIGKEVPGQMYLFKDRDYTKECCGLLDDYVSRDDLGAGVFHINRT